jgi:hypothetical protein
MVLTTLLVLSSKQESKDSKRRRCCRCGAGIEKTAFHADTPGFPLRTEPEILRDLRGFDRLELPRNNQRTVQSSLYFVQSWRANCDIQILLYDSDPKCPNPEDIGRVTDYIVAYACKGNETIVQERQQMKALIMGSSETSGTVTEVKTLARVLLNKVTKEKVISKQECMCHLAGLDLVLCSETIEPVSISGTYKLGTENQAKTTLLSKYATRENTQKDMSLHQFFFFTKEKSSLRKPVIPHYVGGKSYPTYPVTEGHAKSVLTCHVPWIGRSNFKANRNYIQEFQDLVETTTCPKSVKVAYGRVKNRYLQKNKTQEPTSQIQTINYDTFSKDLDPEIIDIVALAGTLGVHQTDNDELDYNIGLNYNWSQQSHQVRTMYKLFYKNYCANNFCLHFTNTSFRVHASVRYLHRLKKLLIG